MDVPMSVLFFAMIAALQPVPSDSDIEYIRLLYKSNKEAFQFGEFRFAYRRGSCARAILMRKPGFFLKLPKWRASMLSTVRTLGMK